MIRSKYGLKALGLCAVVVGLFAFTGVAQAEVGSHWNVNGVANPDFTKLSVSLGAEVEKELVLKAKVGILTVEILCLKLEPVDFLLKNEGGALGKLLFKECQTLLNGSVNAACKPKTGGTSGHITTNLLEGLIVLHKLESGEVDDLVRLVPENAKGELTGPFVIIEFEKGCSLGLTAEVTGKFFLKDCNKLFLVEEVTHLVEEGPLTELFFAGQKATISGSTNLFLNDAEHKGQKWSGTPA